MVFLKVSGIKKDAQWQYHEISSKFLSHSIQKIIGNRSVLLKVSGIENFSVYHAFPSIAFLSHSTESFCGRDFSVFVGTCLCLG